MRSVTVIVSLMLLSNLHVVQANQECEPASASLVVSSDIGHGGGVRHYRVALTAAGHEVVLTTSGGILDPARRSAVPVGSEPTFSAGDPEVLLHAQDTTTTLDTRRETVSAFLEGLVNKFDAYALTDLEPEIYGLHPAFYTFRIEDTCGNAHGFEYVTDVGSHLDERYERLLNAFEAFFQQ